MNKVINGIVRFTALLAGCILGIGLAIAKVLRKRR